MQKYFAGQAIALLTQHGKERVIKPVLDEAIACSVRHVSGFDTDSLGTFTRDISRKGSQLEAARKKARMGMSLSGLPVGVASEGSFGPDPFAGMFNWNVEMLVLIDDRSNLEIVGISQAAAQCGDLVTSDWSIAAEFAKGVGFPEHHLVVRPEGKSADNIFKGIQDWQSFEEIFGLAMQVSSSGKVFIESDLRAHANPTRMENIRLAAIDLSNRVNSHCPECGAPGFWPAQAIKGLPCSACGAPTHVPMGELWKCVACSHQQSKFKPANERANPQHCDLCNP